MYRDRENPVSDIDGSRLALKARYDNQAAVFAYLISIFFLFQHYFEDFLVGNNGQNKRLDSNSERKLF